MDTRRRRRTETERQPLHTPPPQTHDPRILARDPTSRHALLPLYDSQTQEGSETKVLEQNRGMIRWALSALVAASILFVGNATVRPVTPAHATIAWSGGSAPGSGKATWETFVASVHRQDLLVRRERKPDVQIGRMVGVV